MYTEILPPGGNGLWPIGNIFYLTVLLVACLLLKDFFHLGFTSYTRKENMLLEVFMAKIMKNSVFIGLTPCSLE
jgi:hypothetical protein